MTLSRRTTTRVAALMASVLLGAGLAACSDSANSAPTSAAAASPSAARSLSAGSSARAANTLAPTPLQTLTALQEHFVNVVKLVRPSVVEIATNSALGSGIVYNAHGDIVT